MSSKIVAVVTLQMWIPIAQAAMLFKAKADVSALPPASLTKISKRQKNVRDPNFG